jgi:hypothetical protein
MAVFWYDSLMLRKLILTFFCLISWAGISHAQEKQLYGVPDRAKLQRACTLSGGSWEILPRYCDNMHPRSWEKLSDQQKIICYDKFHEPCECGVGRRFALQPRLGCIESRFHKDIWGG